MSQLAYIAFDDYTTLSGEQMNLKLSYKFFGLPLGSAPVVLVNHSLTGDWRRQGYRYPTIHHIGI